MRAGLGLVRGSLGFVWDPKLAQNLPKNSKSKPTGSPSPSEAGDAGDARDAAAQLRLCLQKVRKYLGPGPLPTESQHGIMKHSETEQASALRSFKPLQETATVCPELPARPLLWIKLHGIPKNGQGTGLQRHSQQAAVAVLVAFGQIACLDGGHHQAGRRLPVLADSVCCGNPRLVGKGKPARSTQPTIWVWINIKELRGF